MNHFTTACTAFYKVKTQVLEENLYNISKDNVNIIIINLISNNLHLNLTMIHLSKVS